MAGRVRSPTTASENSGSQSLALADWPVWRKLIDRLGKGLFDACRTAERSLARRGQRAGVGQSAREETAECREGRSGRPTRYGDLTGAGSFWSNEARGRAPGNGEGDRVEVLIADGDRAPSRCKGGSTPRRRKSAQSIRCRPFKPKGRQGTQGMKHRRRHGAPVRTGGARIAGMRAKVSMTLIAAPQQGQTKVGGSLRDGVASAD